VRHGRCELPGSCRQLSDPAARMFRLLGLHPGPDISAPAAASLAGITVPQARRALAELTGAHLVAELAPGRFGFHDLLRAYASELATTGRAAAEYGPAMRRMLDRYLITANTACPLLYPARDPLALGEAKPATTPKRVTSRAQARAWFAARPSRCSGSSATGPRRRAAGSSSARHAGSRASTRRPGRHVEHVLWLYRNLGHPAGQAHAPHRVGWHTAALGDYHAALGCCQRALALHHELGNTLGEAHTWDHLGSVQDHLGEHDDAVTCYRRALGLLREVSDRSEQAGVLTRLGDAHAHPRRASGGARGLAAGAGRPR
jgi:tetratricopeptide (TPR) repeat protein